MKKFIIILIIVFLLILFLPIIPFKQEVACIQAPCGPNIEIDSIFHHYYSSYKFKRDFEFRKEQMKTKKLLNLTIENQPKVDNAGIVVKTLDGKFISRSDISQFYNSINISLDNGRYIFEEYIGGEMIKSFNFDLLLGENEKTISKTIVW